MSNNKTYLGRIKDAVDFIYLLVTESQDGYRSGFSSCDFIVKRVVKVLVDRGALRREYSGAIGGPGRKFIYKWGSTMAPTDNLYKVVMTELQEKKKVENARRNRKRNTVAQTPAQIEVPATPKERYITTLDGFSSQELWDELKKRGYTIEDNRLVIIKKAYLT